MPILSSIGVLFVGLGVLFLAFTLRSYMKVEGKMTIAQRVWLRMTFIFTCVGMGLCLLQAIWG